MSNIFHDDLVKKLTDSISKATDANEAGKRFSEAFAKQTEKLIRDCTPRIYSPNAIIDSIGMSLASNIRNTCKKDSKYRKVCKGRNKLAHIEDRNLVSGMRRAILGLDISAIKIDSLGRISER